jgi:hypothetical protein
MTTQERNKEIKKKIIAVILCILYCYIFYGTLFLTTIKNDAFLNWATSTFTTAFLSILIGIGYLIVLIIAIFKTLAWADIVNNNFE